MLHEVKAIELTAGFTRPLTSPLHLDERVTSRQMTERREANKTSFRKLILLILKLQAFLCHVHVQQSNPLMV